MRSIGVCMALLVALFPCLAASAGPISGQGTWEATLHGRDRHGTPVALDDPNAVFHYDTVLNITWLRDWRAVDGTNIDGLGTKDEFRIGYAALRVGRFGGFRLPTYSGECDLQPVDPVDGNGEYCAHNEIIVRPHSAPFMQDESTFNDELAHLFYMTLGNAHLPLASPRDPASINTAFFEGVDFRSGYYVDGGCSVECFETYVFDSGISYQGDDLAARRGIGVLDGDVALLAVPEPQPLASLFVAVVGACSIQQRLRKRTRIGGIPFPRRSGGS